MHEGHDLDLIAAFADGDLEGDTTLVEELIASCHECRSEFDSQRDIKAILHAAPPVAMTDDEREAVRSGVHARLDQPAIQPSPAPVVVLESRRRSARRWLAIGSIAAATLAIVGVAGVLGQGTSGTGGLDAAVESAGEDGTELTTSDGMELRMPDSDTEETFAADMAQDDSPAAVEESGAASDTTAADGATTAEAFLLSLVDAGQVSQSELDGLIADTLVALESVTFAEELTPAWFNARERLAPACYGSVDDPVYAVINATVGGNVVEVLVVLDEDSGEYRAETFVVPDCSAP